MTKTTAEREKLAAKHPDVWVPISAGDRLDGEVIDLTEAWSDQRNGGSFYPLLTVLTADDVELKVHGFGTVLYNELMKHRPTIGEHVVITYLGASEKAPKPGFNPPELYRVRVVGRDPSVVATDVYGRIGGDAKAAPEPEAAEDLPF